MAQVHVDACGIDAILDSQRLPAGDTALELLHQLVFLYDVLTAAANQGKLFVDGFHALSLLGLFKYLESLLEKS
jgi:hypothetical protein